MSKSIDLTVEEARLLKKREQSRKYYLANKERVSERTAKWQLANKESRRESARKWRKKNPDYGRKWRQANLEHSREYERKWRLANPERAKKASRKWNMANKKRAAEQHRNWAQHNKEHLKEYGRKWRLANPEKFKAQEVRRYKRQRNNPEHRQYMRAYLQNVRNPKRRENPLLWMLDNARRRARLGGGVCTVTVEELATVNDTHCPVLGIEFVIKRGRPTCRTLDRIRPTIWYVPGNVAIVSARANLIKQDATSEELHRVASRLRRVEKGVSPKSQAGPLDELLVMSGQKRQRYKFRMLGTARERAIKAGVPFTITVNDFVIPDRCPFLDVELRKGNGPGGHVPSSPSLDRIDPKKGYIPGNVMVISRRANLIKQNATAGEIKKVAKWLQREEKRIDALGLAATAAGPAVPVA